MSMITVTVDPSPARAFLTDVEQKQIPFATANAINDVAKAFQKREFAEIDKAFTLRRPDWAQRSLKITHFAKKSEQWATIAIQPPPRRDGGDASDILGKFEDQTEKTSTKTGGYVAIAMGAKRTRKDIVRDDQRPKTFEFVRVGNRIIGNRGTFIVTPKSNPNVQLILQRTRAGVQLLYILVKRVPIKPELHYYQTALATVNDTWDTAFTRRLSEALATAK